MKNNIYHTIQQLEKNKENALLTTVVNTQKNVAQLTSSLSNIDHILKSAASAKQCSALFDQNNHDYKGLISGVAQDLKSQYATQHNELQRQQFHLTRQVTRTQLIETIIKKKQQAFKKKQTEKEQARLSDLLAISRHKSIF